MNRSALFRFSVVAVVCAIAFMSHACGDGTGPSGRAGGPVATFALNPVFQTAGPSGIVQFEKVRVILHRADGSVALDTLVDFPQNASEISLELHVALSATAGESGEDFVLNLEMLNAAGVVVFRGGPVSVRATDGAPLPPVDVVSTYTGPGSTATRVTIEPPIVTVLPGAIVNLVATAFDAAGASLPGTPVQFSSLDPAIATVPDPAVGRAIVGATRGTARIHAVLVTGQSADAVITVRPAPSSIVLEAGNSQTGTVGAALPLQLRARVLASDGIGSDGVLVTFAVVSGGGTIGTAQVTTDAQGIAGATLTLGTTPGLATVTASAAGLSGSPVTFTATGIPGPATQFVFMQQPSSGTATVQLTTIVVQARDAFGNLATSYNGLVTLALDTPPAGVSLQGTLTATAVAGIATFNDLRVSAEAAGLRFRATGAGVTGASTSNPVTIAPAPATQLVIAVQPVSGPRVGDRLHIVVEARNAQGSIATQQTGLVRAVIVSGPPGATIVGTNPVPFVTGAATFDLAFNKAGSYQLTFVAPGLPGVSSQVFTIVPSGPTDLVVVSGGGQAGAANTLLPAPLVVQVMDGAGMPMPGVLVTFTVVSGGGSVVPNAPVGDTLTTTMSDTSGRASANWTLGASGVQTVQASVVTLAGGTIAATFPATLIPGLTAIAISAGIDHTCAITSDNALWCWGSNTFGQVGDGTTTARSQPVPAAAGFSFVSVSAGWTTSCALTSAGVAYCWGDNTYGQIGDGTLTGSTSPVAVSGELLFSEIHAGMTFTCGLTTGGAAYCWGAPGARMGNGTGSGSTTPVAVTGGITFQSLSLFADNHVCGVAAGTSGGNAFCWGYNADGAIGDGTTTDRFDPTFAAIVGAPLFSKAASAWYHSCALTVIGTAYCWGDNNVSQLGYGTPPADSYFPGLVSGGHVFTTLVAGGGETCGLTSGGAVWCWGYNGEGGLGTGTTAWSLTPVQVTGGQSFSQISAGEGYTCGITTAGALYCWGRNAAGQVGDGTVTNRLVPVPVSFTVIPSIRQRR